MRGLAALLIISTAFAGAACDRGGAPAGPEEAFTKAIDFGPLAQRVPGPMPLPAAPPVGASVDPIPGGLVVVPSQDITFRIPWKGGAITGINLGFGGSQYFAIKMPDDGNKPNGEASLKASLGADACADLTRGCHDLQVIEQVKLADGASFSAQAKTSLTLDCSDGAGCPCAVTASVAALCDAAQARAVTQIATTAPCRADVDQYHTDCPGLFAVAEQPSAPVACRCPLKTYLDCLGKSAAFQCGDLGLEWTGCDLDPAVEEVCTP